MSSLKHIRTLLKNKACPDKAANPLFFKTGAGQYAEHDRFLGISIPDLRLIAKEGIALSLKEIQALLESEFNEERVLALLILINLYQKGSQKEKDEVYHFYIENLRYVNNWNLVDCSAPAILGAHLFKEKKDLLEVLVQSDNLWERRIAILSTHYDIRQNDFEWTLKLGEKLLKDSHDLIHKAVGWMLREMGKRNEKPLREFLDRHAAQMPRTMLRYAIERFPSNIKDIYLKKERTGGKVGKKQNCSKEF